MQEAECLEGLGEGTLILDHYAGRQSQYCLEPQFLLSSPTWPFSVFFFLEYQITQETLVAFKHLCFFPIIYILENWDYILKDYEINGCVCLSLKLNCINFCLD